MARPKIRPEFKESDLGINPHVGILQVPIVDVSIDGQFKTDSEGIHLPAIAKMEYTPFTKLFSKREHRLIISRCTPAAKSLYLWIMYEIEVSKDYIWINKHRYLKETLTSLNTFKKALTELHRYSLITPTTIKDVYWINPEYFFKGSRITKYSKNLKEI